MTQLQTPAHPHLTPKCLSILHLSLCEKFRSSYLGKATAPQEQRYPKVWLPMLRIFNVRLGSLTCAQVLNTSDCPWGLHRHRRRACTESWLWEKNHPWRLFYDIVTKQRNHQIVDVLFNIHDVLSYGWCLKRSGTRHTVLQTCFTRRTTDNGR